MTLYINTADRENIIIALYQGAKTVAQKKIKAPRCQAEKLLPAIAALLKSRRLKPSALKKILVANRGGSFTALRIGIITANALAYALDIPVTPAFHAAGRVKKFADHTLVEPIYEREPSIGRPKKRRF